MKKKKMFLVNLERELKSNEASSPFGIDFFGEHTPHLSLLVSKLPTVR
jgi:hypothetical protein